MVNLVNNMYTNQPYMLNINIWIFIRYIPNISDIILPSNIHSKYCYTHVNVISVMHNIKSIPNFKVFHTNLNVIF